MKICIPVEQDQGLDSPICAHFGSTPFFLIVDSDTQVCEAIPNNNMSHQHGMCQPLAALQGYTIDVMVVGGIGMGAVQKLQAAGVQPYIAQSPIVRDNLEALKAGTLQPVTMQNACNQHGQGHGHDQGSGKGPGGCGH